MILDYILKPAWELLLDWSGLQRWWCRKKHRAFHGPPVKVFYDGTCVIWCRKCEEALWRK